MKPARISRIVIVGGGSAGWMAAAMLGKALGGPSYEITLVESADIGTVGVGEATIPAILAFNRALGLDEDEFVRETKATFKLGILFRDWREKGHAYVHPFGSLGTDMDGVGFPHFWMRLAGLDPNADFGRFSLEATALLENRFSRGPNEQPGLNYAFQFDAALYAAFLRRYAEARGVRRRQGTIVEVRQEAESGFVQSVRLEDGQEIAGDLFIDCSGFRGLLIEQTMGAGFEDWSEWLPCNRAAAVACEPVEASAAALTPFTTCTALESGWRWRIPLQHRVGNGYVFCDGFISEDEACARILSGLEGRPLGDPKVLRFTAGRRRRMWVKNVVAVGLAGGFLEPLESTSIHLGQAAITKLISLFPKFGFAQSVIDQYNADIQADYANVRDFLIAHYKITRRDDTPFWRRCQAMPIPESLAARLDIFRRTGHAYVQPSELFRETSWFSVLYGQGLTPEAYHPMVDVISDGDLKLRMARIRTNVQAQVAALPDHRAFLERLGAFSGHTAGVPVRA
jgi:tryptophan halogenase